MFSFSLAFATEKKNQAYICNIVQKVGSAAEDLPWVLSSAKHLKSSRSSTSSSPLSLSLVSKKSVKSTVSGQCCSIFIWLVSNNSVSPSSSMLTHILSLLLCPRPSDVYDSFPLCWTSAQLCVMNSLCSVTATFPPPGQRSAYKEWNHTQPLLVSVAHSSPRFSSANSYFTLVLSAFPLQASPLSVQLVCPYNI